MQSTDDLTIGQAVLYRDRYAADGPAWVPATYQGPYRHPGALTGEVLIDTGSGHGLLAVRPADLSLSVPVKA